MTDFRMPSLGADMNEGTVLEWKVAPGQAFAKGDVVVEVDTDKAAFEVEADDGGVMAEILVRPGTTVAVGTVLARLEGADRMVAGVGTGESPSGASSLTRPRAELPRDRSATTPGRPRVSPRARKRARELQVDLAAIPRGRGVDGAIDVADVEAAARSGAAASGTERPEASRSARLRGVIAAAMSRSKREIPHYYLAHDIDLEPALHWLEGMNASRPITARILPSVVLFKAVAQALRAVPELNGYWVDGGFEPQPAVHLGVAISLRGGGVIAPALHDVQDKPLEALMAELSDLVRRARAGTVRHREMIDGTITITSLGDRGTDLVHGVIFPPQVALIGFGSVTLRPRVVDGQVQPRRAVTATLSGDHRASDGHRGALFLRELADRLQEPESL